MRQLGLWLALATAACSGTEFSAPSTSNEGGTGDSGAGIPTTGLVLWLDAESGIDAESGSIATWHDRSPAGNDATQTNAAAQPKVVPGALRGHAAVALDGQDDGLRLPSGFADFDQGLSFFAVLRSASAGTCPQVIQLSNGSEIDDVSIQREGAAHLSYEVGANYVNGAKDLYPIQTPVLIGVTHAPGGDVELYGGANSETGGNFPLPPQVKRTQNSVGYGLYANCTHYEGLMGELLLYRRLLSDTEQGEVRAYLADKWGF